MTDPRTLAATYHDGWRDKDFERVRSVLADDATFRGPIAAADDVLTWFELHTFAAPPCPTASWAHTDHGKVRTSRAVFDPRPLPLVG